MKRLRHIIKLVLCVLIGLVVLSVVQVIAARWLPVYRTPLMGMRAWEYRADSKFQTRYEWVPLSDISPQLVMAVIASEDNRFEQHWGFDWVEINKALNRERRQRPRGASTITQQVAKNVFLWPGRSWLRKGLEAYYTALIELFWSKRHIMEVYLNVAEMGKGVYGAPAAAQYYYGKPAIKLSAAESAMLAVCLPNPQVRNPKKPTSFLRQRQQAIMKLMRKIAKPELLK